MGENGPPLCLACADKMQSILDRQFIQNAAMMNMAADEMDAATGFMLPSGRIPVGEIAKAIKGRAVLNNITINNSNVGMLNAGDFSLAKIDAVITIAKGTDVEAVGNQLQSLTQAILDTAKINADQKKELLDLVQALGEQVVGPGKRSVIKSIMKGIEDRAQGLAAVFEIAKTLSAIINKYFGF